MDIKLLLLIAVLAASAYVYVAFAVWLYKEYDKNRDGLPRLSAITWPIWSTAFAMMMIITALVLLVTFPFRKYRLCHHG